MRGVIDLKELEMSPSTKQRNLAARMGRWSAHHWKTATFGWLALVVVAFGIGGMVGTKAPDPSTSGPGQSGRMDRILDAGFKQPAAESVLIQSTKHTAGSPAFDAAVQDVAARISKVPVVRHVESPKISKDGDAVLVDFDIAGERDIEACARSDAVHRAHDREGQRPELQDQRVEILLQPFARHHDFA